MIFRNKDPKITLGAGSLLLAVGLIGIRFFAVPIGEEATFIEGFKIAFFYSLLSASVVLNIIGMFRLRKRRHASE